MERTPTLTRSSSFLAGGLVEPGPHIALPVLLEVTIRDDVVVLHHGASPEGHKPLEMSLLPKP